MSFSLKHAALALVAIAALTLAIVEVNHVGIMNENKSLYSYLLKSGDSNPKSAGALAHVQGAAAYGHLVAVRIAIGSMVFGILVGILAAPRLGRSATAHAA